ncbi:MAG: bifunctional DNA primase/polymerase [Rhodospirillales bacterium]|nr:bifunctional DNA primase/polymerase [Rhodospirillales bacterium]
MNVFDIANSSATGAAVAALRHDLGARGYHPVPIRSGEKRPIYVGWPERARAGEFVAGHVDAALLSTGIECSGLRGIDFDCDEEDIAGQVAFLAGEILGPPGAVRFRDGSPRMIWLYRAAEGSPGKRRVAAPRASEDEPSRAVEILGRGQQFVADGLHPSGAQYRWDRWPLPPVAELPTVTEEQLTRLLAAAAAILGAPPEGGGGGQRVVSLRPAAVEGDKAHDPAALAAIVRALPNDQRFDAREQWIALAHAIPGALADDPDLAQELWFEHAAKRPQTEGEPERVWESLTPPHHAGEHFILAAARAAGLDVGAYEAEKVRAAFASAGALPVDPGGPIILSAPRPLDSARMMIRKSYFIAPHRTLHHQQGTFYRWRGTHYAEAAAETIRADAWSFLDAAMQRTASGLVPFCPNRAKVANVLEAIAAATQLPDGTQAPAWLDGADNPPAAEILPCANGLLHIPTRILLPPTPAFFGLNAVGYPYDPSAPAPTAWLGFLSVIWPDDPEAISTLQELCGYLLAPDTRQQKAFLLIGPRRSGKGTIARVLTALLGKENVAGPTLASMTQNFGLAPLIGKPLAIISDARLGANADASVVAERLLAITGEDAISVDRKFRDAWTGRLPTRFVILTNLLPRLTDASGALASRFILLALSKSFYGREDTTLTGKLLRELPGILRWSLAGYDRLRARGHFVQPASGLDAMRALEDLGSPIGAFLRDRCAIGADKMIETGHLFSEWLLWCREQHRDHPGTAQTFGRDLRGAIPGLRIMQPRDSGGRERIYVGLGLVDRGATKPPMPPIESAAGERI